MALDKGAVHHFASLNNVHINVYIWNITTIYFNWNQALLGFFPLFFHLFPGPLFLLLLLVVPGGALNLVWLLL